MPDAPPPSPPERTEAPTFAVVGQPNKGKSSIVATLAEDDRVDIRPESGTTRVARRFTASGRDGTPLYTLIDTPGFQRARRALDWMKRHETTAADHPEAVRRFVEGHRRDPRHADEVELLSPIVAGAAVLYVVDGSTPFGPEYEPEMEILRWTGRPSMALINPIGEADHVEAWRRALGQYFRVVRVFNALAVEFDKRIALLEAFSQLDESWEGPMRRAAVVLREQREVRREASAQVIAAMLLDVLTLRERRKLETRADPTPHKPALEQKLRDRIRARERACRQQVQALYRHHRLELDEDELDVLGDDLFSEATWTAFGLSRGELAKLGGFGGALAGGAAGASIDLTLGGLSGLAPTLLGTAAGGLGGALGGWWTSDRLAKIRVLDQPLGGKLLEAGPIQNPNLRFVLLGRAVAHHHLVANRTHAQLGVAAVSPPPKWPDDRKRRLARLFRDIARGKAPLDALTARAKAEIEPLLA